jgi:type I restriction enzyme S subunit
VSSQQDSLLEALPKDWTIDRLKDVVALRNEKTAEASTEIDYLELEDIESGTGRILGRRNTLAVESAVTIFKRGDILFGKLRPYLEKYYTADFDGKCTGEILAFKPERIAGRFLFYCVASRWFIERCNALAYGAKMPRVSWPTQLAQFNVPLPPLPEQERIAAYLDASCAAIDAAAAAKRRQLETLEALGKTTINLAVTRGCDERAALVPTDSEWFPLISAAWRIVRFKTLFRTIYRYPNLLQYRVRA